MRVAAVVLAGGSGTRVGADRNKVYLTIAGRSIISWSLRTMAALPAVTRLVLVIRPADRELVGPLLATELPGVDVELVDGGAQRQDSELQALRHLAPEITAGDIDIVAIHDGARPLATAELMNQVLDAAARYGGAVPGLPASGLVATGDNGVATPLSGRHVGVQTPQAFAAVPLLAAYEAAARDDYSATDTAGCMQRYSSVEVRCVPGGVDNLKVTTPADLVLAESLLGQRR
ncbi:MAG TPA: IspD/TarI family cytidylyltransferase [Mycobacteriales bacterium]|nr:IspD/TarI family cytidylyltransferase [Mycobacteriales bacterium]